VKKLLNTLCFHALLPAGVAARDDKDADKEDHSESIEPSSDGVKYAVRLYPSFDYEEALRDAFAKMEARADLETNQLHALFVVTCAREAVERLLDSLTKQESFAASFPRMATIIRKRNLAYFFPSIDQSGQKMTTMGKIPGEKAFACGEFAWSSESSSAPRSSSLPNKATPASLGRSWLSSASRAQPDNAMPTPASLGRSCASCGMNKAGLLLCSGCRSVRYCSEAHQKADWRHHKAQCKKVSSANTSH